MAGPQPCPHYLTLPAGQLRLWRCGEGPDVAVLHGLALGAEATAARLAEAWPGRRVTVLELPGVGGSAGLATGDLAEAARRLDAALDFCVAHDAPLVACDLSIAVAARMRRRPAVTLGAGAAQSWARRGWRLPSLAPRQDGTHLTALWAHLRDAHFFEPDDPTQPARLGEPLPSPTELDSTVVAAAADPAAYERLWSACIDSLQLGAAADAFGATGAKDLPEAAALLQALPQPARAPGLPSTKPLPAGLWNQYVQTSRGRMHLRRAGGEGRPLLVIPTGGGSSAQFAPVVTGLARGRQAFAVDYLGNGLSEKPDRAVTIGDLADDMAALIESLGFPEVDVWGSHTGALVGLELAVRRPDLVGRAVLEGPVFISPDFQQDLLAHYFPPLRPDPWGLHLQFAWNWRRDMFLYWPWYRVERAAARQLGLPSAEQLNLYTVGILESGPTYDRAYRSAFAYDTRARMPLLRRPALVCAGPNDMLVDGLKEAEALAVPSVQVRMTPTTVWWPDPEPEAAARAMAIYDAFLSPET
ncbi:alpha/beta hydrolase [Alsobacter soli]|uniref:Alpha/beta hydrolase n=1 Tax=Alsobacter soli TaxID=2109933 RepID=A0A2T1HX82_9HYPH|nr:alpha/beta hydrolase [Alsobacter soli]PSC06292.1 alpha/beta hydrolase [Alsobacter soli]